MTVNSAADLPLAGIRILDLSRIVAGPNATMQLADMGAEVIKVETPGGGDDTRRMMPPTMGEESAFYLAFNRNKRSMVIDLKTEDGRNILYRLTERADVVVENFRPGVTKRLGVDYETLSAIKPELVYCSVSAYGQDGPMSQRPGLDPVLQAEMGLMTLNGEPEGDPLRHPLSLTDLYTGMQAATAICAALVRQQTGGRGCHIDLSLMGGAMAMLGNMGTYAMATGHNPPRMGNGFPTVAPVGAFKGSDGGMFYTACGTQKLFDQLAADALEMPELLEDPRFTDNGGRVENRDALMGLLADTFATRTRDEWVAKIRAAGVPAGPVRNINDACNSEEVRAAGLMREVEHPTAGKVTLPGSSIRFRGEPELPLGNPPLYGEHTDTLLAELLAMDEAEIEALRAAKIVA